MPDYCELFTNETITSQLEKILISPTFATSVVLSRFLIYIVNETLSGKSTNIKEYNIGVNVLQKRLDFKPNSNGVVRVHARRLRTALENYYNSYGMEDECLITIPKGRYVPSFVKLKNTISKNFRGSPMQDKNIRLAVLPFHCFEDDHNKLSFAENIVLMLNAEFGGLKQMSVLSYFAIQQLMMQKISIRKLASQYSLKYLVTGTVQFESSRVRIMVQIMNGFNGTLVWSNRYDFKYSSKQFFKLEDKVVREIMTDLEQFHEIFNPFITEITKGNIEKEEKVYFLNKYIKNQSNSKRTV